MTVVRLATVRLSIRRPQQLHAPYQTTHLAETDSMEAQRKRLVRTQQTFKIDKKSCKISKI